MRQHTNPNHPRRERRRLGITARQQRKYIKRIRREMKWAEAQR